MTFQTPPSAGALWTQIAAKSRSPRAAFSPHCWAAPVVWARTERTAQSENQNQGSTRHGTHTGPLANRARLLPTRKKYGVCSARHESQHRVAGGCEHN